MENDCEKTLIKTMTDLAGKATSETLLKQNETIKQQAIKIRALEAENASLKDLLKAERTPVTTHPQI